MLEIIPAIDLLNQKVVRLTQGDYNRVDHYDYQPQELAKLYEEAGATRIHIVDLNGAKEGELVNLEVIKKIRAAVSCKIELGGGIRNKESVAQLLGIGIDYIILGSLLVKNTDLALEIIDAYPGKIIAGIDAKDDNVAVEGWLEASSFSVASLIDRLEDKDIASIIYTDIARDGMMTGPNLDSLKKVVKMTKIPLIASGGISCLADLRAVKDIASFGIEGCIVGKAILSNAIELKDLFN